MLINVSVSYIHQGFVNDPWFGQVEIRVQNFWALTYRNKCNDYSMPKSYIIMQLNGREGANLWSTSITNYGHNHAIKKRRCNVRKLLEFGAWTEARGEAFKWDRKWSKGAERAVKGRGRVWRPFLRVLLVPFLILLSLFNASKHSVMSCDKNFYFNTVFFLPKIVFERTWCIEYCNPGRW